MHLYHREIREEVTDSLSWVANLVQLGQTVLDLGMGTGALGRYLNEHKDVVCDGVTINAEEARLASEVYRRTVVADLDHIELASAMGQRCYDCVVCADVFEHLKSPQHLLQQIPSVLNTGGRLIASIPNAAYAGLVAELMAGEFQYRAEGLLDETHLRFFTLSSIERWFKQHGWALHAVHRIEKPLTESEFSARLEALPPAVATYLSTRPESWVYQYVVEAKPLAEGQAELGPDAERPSSEIGMADFVVQLYWANSAGFAEVQKLVARGRVGESQQELVFALWQLGNGEVQAIRLDPSDRPGYVHLQQIRLCDRNGITVWAWQGQHPQDVADALGWPSTDLLMSPASGTCGGVRLLVHGDDPMIELPIPATVLARLADKGLELRVQMGWPLSADFLALVPQVQALKQRQDQLLGELKQSRAELCEKTVQLEHSNEQALLQQLQAQSQLEVVQQALQGHEQELHSVRTQHQHLQADFARIQDHVRVLEGLAVVRWTRPLARFKLAVKRKLFESVVTNDNPELASPPPLGPSPVHLAAHQRPGVDVIVPVYRGLQDTRSALESLVSCHYTMPVRVIVINDHSPEPELVEWLKAFAHRAHPIPVELHHNPQNLGFVGTVNKGMSLDTERDVVLFNSDAQAANNWLDRLQDSAYRHSKAATATPFSNNATICSYPRFCEENPMPVGETTASMDLLCAQYLGGQSVEIPTAHGFCMYIRRAALQTVGLFDVENFGKGYGEENDFCLRASRAGWVHVHALDVFVQHAGGISFGSSKAPAVERAIGTLRRLYPHYEATVHAYIQHDPARISRRVLDLARTLRGVKPVVLNITHNRQGGTLRHLQELAHSLSEQAHFLQLQPCAGGVSLGLSGLAEELEWVFELPKRMPELVATLQQLRVAHVHFHHLLDHGDEVLQLPALLGVSYDVTIHDYFLYCPQISLTDSNDRYCGETGPDQCRQCLQQRPAPQGLSLEQWHQRHRELLQGARHVLCPTAGSAQRISRFAPKAPVVLVAHMDMPAGAVYPVRHAGPRGERSLRVAVVGAMSKIKGADVLEQTANLAGSRHAPIEFHLLGYTYRKLQVTPAPMLTVHGEYAEAQLPELLAHLAPDVVWFPAQCPETYAYTLSACLHAGVPIVASDVGAFSDRLPNRPLTWRHAWDSTPAQWLDHLLSAGQELNRTAACEMWPDHRSTSGAAQALPAWAYQSDYTKGIGLALQGLTSSETPTTIIDTVRQLIAQMLSPGALPSTGARGQGQKCVNLLYRLRQLPLLSSLVRCIPTHFQRRVKSWLLGMGRP